MSRVPFFTVIVFPINNQVSGRFTGRLKSLFKRVHVADMVGKNQDKPGIQAVHGDLTKPVMGLSQCRIEITTVLKIVR